MISFRYHDPAEERESGLWAAFAPVFPVLMLLVFMLAVVLSLQLAYRGSATVSGDGLGTAATNDADKADDRKIAALQEKVELLEKENAELAGMQKKIQELAGVRGRILDQLTAELGKLDLDFEINRNRGTVRFNKELTFASDSRRLDQRTRKALERFIPVFASVLLSDENKDYIEQIVIEGHTSGEGSYSYNMELSLARAGAVLNYITDEDFPEFPLKDEMVLRLSTSGLSYSQPVRWDGEVVKALSRRVEFKFVLKDDKVAIPIEQLAGGDE